jgi:hypothetical protein
MPQKTEKWNRRQVFCLGSADSGGSGISGRAPGRAGRARRGIPDCPPLAEYHARAPEKEVVQSPYRLLQGDAMSTEGPQYTIAGVDVSDVRNRNEIRIVEKMQYALEKLGNPEMTVQAVRDAYALALNLLPARYKQSGTIVLREPIRESHLEEAAMRALKQVLNYPKI